MRRTRRTSLHREGTPTVHDVAKAAGVSTASVSRALNAPDSVSVELRERVAKAVAALGYVRNGAGRALASQRSGVVGVVLPALADGLHEVVLASLEARLRPAGYLVAVTIAGADDASERTRKLLSLGVEGIVSIGNAGSAEIRRLADGRRIPCIDVVGDGAPSNADCVAMDFARAASTVAQYLHGLGHRRFALLAGRDDAPLLWAARRRSLQDALSALQGASVIEAVVSSFESAVETSAGLMRQPTPPTAVVCTDDLTAAAAVRGCESAGSAVPNDVSVTGIGDSEWARHTRPALTTLRLPASAAGVAAASRFLARLDGQAIDAPTLVARLVVRGTSAPPPR